MRCSHVALSLGTVLAGAVMAFASVDGRDQLPTGYDYETPPCCMNPTAHEGHFQSATDWRGEESTEGNQEYVDTRENYSQYDDPQFAEPLYQPQYHQADEAPTQAPESNDTSTSSSDTSGESDYTYRYEYACPSAKYGENTRYDEGGNQAVDNGGEPASEEYRYGTYRPEESAETAATQCDSAPRPYACEPYASEPVADEYRPAETEPDTYANEYRHAETEPAVTPETEQSSESLANEYRPTEPDTYANEHRPAETEPAAGAESERPSGQSAEPTVSEYQSVEGSPSVANEFEGFPKSFGWLPSELLTESDQELLWTLAAQAEEQPESRQTTLVDYFESLGFEACDFAWRVEEWTEVATLSLADDRPALAALLGVFRLVERGELDQEQGITLILDAVGNLPSQWVDGVEAISTAAEERCTDEQSSLCTGEETDDPSADNMTSAGVDENRPAEGTLLNALKSLGARSLGCIDGVIRSISQRIAAVAAGAATGEMPANPLAPSATFNWDEITD